MNSTFVAMREEMERAKRETNKYADDVLGLLGQLEQLHLRKRAAFQTLTEHPNEKFDNLFSSYSSLLNELAPRRVQTIQTGDEAIQSQSIRMRNSRKSTMNTVKRRLDEDREKQQLVADASELMKHYKALIMAA